MYLKKKMFFVGFMVLLACAAFGQTGESIGLMASYNPRNPEFKTLGLVYTFDEQEFKYGLGMGGKFAFTFGTTTLVTEDVDAQSKKIETSHDSFYMDLIIGQHLFWNFIDPLALRLGADIHIAYAPAFKGPSSEFVIIPHGLDMAWFGSAGLALFPKKKYSLSFDICPGVSFFTGAYFIMPLRLAVGLNF